MTTAAESGKKLRDAVAPPSFVDRAAELKAAKELGLVAVPDDPLADIRKQLEEQRLLAELAIARQIASSSSPPLFVRVSTTLASGA